MAEVAEKLTESVLKKAKVDQPYHYMVTLIDHTCLICCGIVKETKGVLTLLADRDFGREYLMECEFSLGTTDRNRDIFVVSGRNIDVPLSSVLYIEDGES